MLELRPVFCRSPALCEGSLRGLAADATVRPANRPPKKGPENMRRTILFLVIAAVCLSGAALYLYPQIGDRAKQLLVGASTALSAQQSQSGQQTQAGGQRSGAAQQAQSGQQSQGGSGRRGGAGAGPVSVITAAAPTADFPIRRHAIGFVSSP